jgi:hypothetical protein
VHFDDDAERRWLIPGSEGPSASICISQDVERRDGPPALSWDSEVYLATSEEARDYGRDLVLAAAVLDVIVAPITKWSWDLKLLPAVAQALGLRSGAALIERFEPSPK